MRSLRSPALFRAAGAALALLSAALVPPDAQGQLYTWKDAQGNITIKNTPPPWYSESARPRGARVQVLRNGKVIDDTAWPAEKRQEGRNTDARQENKRAESVSAPNPAKKEDDDE
jgi:hypothetical protein